MKKTKKTQVQNNRPKVFFSSTFGKNASVTFIPS